MHWKEQLKAGIENARNGSKRTLVIPGSFYRYVKIDVHRDAVNEFSYGLWRPAIGHVNDHEFCGAARGTLLITSYQYTLTGERVTFAFREVLREPVSWNDVDAGWPYFDFDSLP